MKTIKRFLSYLNDGIGAIGLIIILLLWWRLEVRNTRQNTEIDALTTAINHSTLGAAVAEQMEIQSEIERKAAGKAEQRQMRRTQMRSTAPARKPSSQAKTPITQSGIVRSESEY